MNRGLFKVYDSLCTTAYNWGNLTQNMLKTPLSYLTYAQYQLLDEATSD